MWAVPGAHHFPRSPVLLCHGSRHCTPRVSVDAIIPVAGALPGKEFGIRFQGAENPGRRQAFVRIPELELAQELFDDGRVLDETDDAQLPAAFDAPQGAADTALGTGVMPKRIPGPGIGPWEDTLSTPDFFKPVRKLSCFGPAGFDEKVQNLQ